MSQHQQQQQQRRRALAPRMSVVFWEVATATHETDPIKSTDETMDESTAEAHHAIAEATARRLLSLEESNSRRLDDSCSCSVRSIASNLSTRSNVTVVSIPQTQDEDATTDDLELWEVPLSGQI